MTNRKSTTGFPTSYIDGVRTLPLRPQRVGQEAIFIFLNKIQFQSNKITFKCTRSLCNVVSFKRDNNVCACAVNTLVLLPVINLTLEMNSATWISYMTWNVLPFDAAFVYFGDFSLRMRSFDYISPSGLKSDIIFDFSAPFSYKVVVISGM